MIKMCHNLRGQKNDGSFTFQGTIFPLEKSLQNWAELKKDVVKEACWDLEKKDELELEIEGKAVHCLWQLLTVLYVICFMGGKG